MEMGFIDKLIEMSKQEMEQSDGLSNGDVCTEGKFIVNQRRTKRPVRLGSYSAFGPAPAASLCSAAGGPETRIHIHTHT